MTSFFGDPTYKPRDKDVARFIEYIRDVTDRFREECGEFSEQGHKRVLKLCTSVLHAIIAFVENEFGPKEALALIDRLRSEILKVD